MKQLYARVGFIKSTKKSEIQQKQKERPPPTIQKKEYRVVNVVQHPGSVEWSPTTIRWTPWLGKMPVVEGGNNYP